jgi:predicted transcriptional regulator
MASRPSTSPAPALSRRERQIMDIVYARGKATAAEVVAALPDPPSYSAVRALLRILEQKGHLRHEEDGVRYLFLPTVPRDRARKSALRNLVHTFFEGSAGQAAAALLDRARLSPQEIDRLEALIERAKSEGR